MANAVKATVVIFLNLIIVQYSLRAIRGDYHPASLRATRWLLRPVRYFSIEQPFKQFERRYAQQRAVIRSRENGVTSIPRKQKPSASTLTHWSFLCAHFRDLNQQRGTMSDISIPGGRIRSFVERIEHIDTELQELNEGKKEVFAEAKAEGFDVKILKEIIKLRKQDQDERDEHETLLDMYMRAMETAGPEQAAKAA
jgi:uncharacterized protein (UPF0335 family)